MEAGSHARQPIYTADNTNPAYQFNWGLTIFWRGESLPDQAWLQELQKATEPDGVRILQHRTSTRGACQFFLSTKPHVSPSEIIRSVKGRLQHRIGKQLPKAFQRNYAIRSVGDVTRSVVEEYVAEQFGHHRMADPRVQQMLGKYQRTYEVDLKAPVFSSHGEYWYNLHVVLVNEARWMEIRSAVLDALAAMVEGVCAKYELRLSRMAILADHIHLVVGCPVDRSPESIALAFLNNCAYACGMKAVFRFGYYAGTIGEYDRGAIQ